MQNNEGQIHKYNINLYLKSIGILLEIIRTAVSFHILDVHVNSLFVGITIIDFSKIQIRYICYNLQISTLLANLSTSYSI